MKDVVRTILIICLGVILIPSLFFLAVGLGTTIIAWLFNPKVMFCIVIVLGIFSLPGIIIGLLARK